MRKIRTISFTLIAVAAGFLLVRPWPSASAAKPPASMVLSGTTRAGDGATLDGVTVSARGTDSTITTTVYSDEQGHYYFPPLPAGKYRVWAQAVGFEADRAETSLGNSASAHQDFKLKSTPDFTKQLVTFEYMSALPEDTLPNRRMKAIFKTMCAGGCHQGDFVLQNRFDEAGWMAILNTMENMSVIGKPVPSNPYIHHYKGELAAYLAKMRGPGPSPMKLKPSPRPSGEAARVVETEYAIPPAETPGEYADMDGNDWSEGVPSLGNGTRGMHDLAIDFNGNAWVTDGEDNRYRGFLKVDTETGKVKNFRLPGGASDFPLGSHGIKTDPTGIIWVTVGRPDTVTNNGVLGRIDPKTEKVELFTPPPDMAGFGITIEIDGKGKVWGAASNGAITFDPETKKFRYFKSPTRGVGGYSIAGDADGNGWFSDPTSEIMGFADTETGKVTDIPLAPVPGMEDLLTPEDKEFYAQVKGGGNYKITSEGPRRMGSHGTDVWWANWFGNSISRADIRTHKITYYPLPIPTNPYLTQIDKNGMVWVPLFGDDRVARFDPNTQQWTIFKLPAMGNEMRYVTIDNRKDPVEVWVPSYRTSKITRIQFRSKEQLQATAASLTAAK